MMGVLQLITQTKSLFINKFRNKIYKHKVFS